MPERISIARIGKRWAVKHQNGVLGYVNSSEEAENIGRDLVDWLVAQGRGGDLVFEGLQASLSEALA